MHDPLPVRLVQRIRDLNSNGQRLVERQCALLQPLRQRLAIEILHDQEVRLTFLANVVEGADVRVVQGSNRSGFALEPLLQIGVIGDMLGQHLDGDGAVQAGVAGFVDLAL